MLNSLPTLFENRYALCVASIILVLFFVDVLMQTLYSLPLRHLIRHFTFYHHKRQKFLSSKGDIEDLPHDFLSQGRSLRRSETTTKLATLASQKKQRRRCDPRVHLSAE
eukprot:UN03885